MNKKLLLRIAREELNKFNSSERRRQEMGHHSLLRKKGSGLALKFNTHLLELIGNTPIADISFFSLNPNVKIFAKLEMFNPSGSIKDRVALRMIEDAEKMGLLKKGMPIIEPTSGNTGIALSFVAATKGYDFIAVMPESVSVERRSLIEAYGGKVVLVEGNKNTNYSLDNLYKKVYELRDLHKGVVLDQFKNDSNYKVHKEDTAKEIFEQIPEITHFVAGIGTGGTLAGVSQGLFEMKKVESWGGEPELKSKIQGLHSTKDYLPPILEKGKIKGILLIDDEQSLVLTRQLLKMGIPVGLSSGANLSLAIRLAEEITTGVVTTVFADGIDRYLSTNLI